MPDRKIITYLTYTCSLCNQGARVKVPTRNSQTNLNQWLEQIARRLDLSHYIKSPSCSNRIFDVSAPELEIIENSEDVGTKTLTAENQE